MPNMTKIIITKANSSKLSDLDFANIPFGKIFSDHMFIADYEDGEWKNLRIIPFGDLEISPVNLAIHYGQSIFEGMKAAKMNDGTPVLFRPELHVERLNASADRMMMPNIPADIFLNAVHTLVDLEKDWIPNEPGSAMYIRPFMFATDAKLGVQVSETYKFIIVVGPVGPYYPKPISLLAETEYTRAANGGVGEAKTSGNYAASLKPASLAKKRGYDQVVWLDSNEFKYVQEVGTMNLFFVLKDKVITPGTEGTILKGITRKSIIEILKSKNITVEERRISLDEIFEAHEKGELLEIFGSGTAAVVANVAKMDWNDKSIVFNDVAEHKIANGLRDIINGMRAGTVADDFGWIVPVRSTVSAV